MNLWVESDNITAKKEEQREEKRGILKDSGDGCVAREFESDYPEATANRKTEVAM